MIGNSENRIIYNGNGVATEFGYSFKILEKTDINVVLVDPDLNETALTKDYFVDMEKSVVFYPGYSPGAEPPEAERPPVLPEGWQLVLYREVPITQESQLDTHWPFNVIEAALDKLTIICQQLWDGAIRAIRLSDSAPTDISTVLPRPMPNEGFYWDETGKKLVSGPNPKFAMEQAQASADAAKKSETAAAESAGSAKEDAEKAEDAAERAEDILLRFESGTITKEFTASDSRWTENNGMWRLTMAMGNSRLIGVYKEVKKPQYEMVLTGVYMDAVNVIIEVPERFAGIVILASLTKKTGDKVYIKNFTEEDFTEVGSDYVLTISAEEHQAGSRPIIVSLTKIIDGVSYPYYANTGVDNNGNVVINVSEAFTGKIILDGGYLQ
jgi:predicted tail fiber protein|nr:MAG TPA: tail fiber protein [Caudoviricetes sp.]